MSLDQISDPGWIDLDSGLDTMWGEGMCYLIARSRSTPRDGLPNLFFIHSARTLGSHLPHTEGHFQ
jgi:hypothetical protein